MNPYASENLDSIYKLVRQEFERLRPQSIRPAEGFIKYDYLIPAGFYKQMWDWDGFFIGVHLASIDQPKYLKYWVLNFAAASDEEGYVAGCITTKGPRPLFGKFAMKPFIAQGVLIASKKSNDFSWINEELYRKLQKIISYREKISYDESYGLFFWDDAMSSGADNNVVLTNDKNLPGAFISVDLSAFMYREYKSMAKISSVLGYSQEREHYLNKASNVKEKMQEFLWDDLSKSFWNVFRSSGRKYKRVSYSNFIPLIDKDLLSEKNGQEFIQSFLWNETHMLASYGLRTLSQKDPDYNNENIIVPYSNWQGPVWPIANFLYSVGLKNYGFNDECTELASKLGKLVLDDIKDCGTMHENYHADTGEPLAPTAEQSKDNIFTGFVGWNLLVQNMLGSVCDKNGSDLLDIS